MPICNRCGNRFKSITNTHLEKEHKITLKDYQLEYPLAIIRDQDVKDRMYKNHSAIMSKLRLSGVVKPLPLSLKRRQKLSVYMKSNNPVHKKGVIDKIIATKNRLNKWHTQPRSLETRMMLSESKKGEKNPMKIPEVAIKSAMGHNRKKSSIEIRFDKVIADYKLPLMYVGNNKKWIGGKNPDYVNEDLKLVVEVTSDAYKRLENGYEQNRINHFKQYGYRTITVRYTHCNKININNLHHNFGVLLTQLIYDISCYRIYHTKEGKADYVQF